MSAPRRTVALHTLGCARNEVDSEELAGRLERAGWTLVADPARADVTLVNTCGFIEQAKKDSVDALLAAADTCSRVVAVGCMAERYGAELAAALPEAAAVLSFDDYAAIGDRLDDVLDGRPLVARTPSDRRTMLPISPVDRSARALVTPPPGHGLGNPVGGSGPASGPESVMAPLRRRLAGGPVAPLKLASGCDRRCAFCAIPSFRGAFVSRRPGEVLAEARWLAGQGVRELVLVSENSTSYGKDLGDLRLLESLLPRLAAVDGIEWVRLSYLQPAELRPSLIDVIAGTPGVVAYFDLSFQHASGPLLRRMRRFGDAARFLDLLGSVRERTPLAGIRSNVIVGFPGETEADLAVLKDFLVQARLDVVGVFGYSDEEGTEAAELDGKLPAEEVAARVSRLAALVDELVAERAEERVGEQVRVLVEEIAAPDEGADEGADGCSGGPGCAVGRAEHQAPDVDGVVTLAGPWPASGEVGALVRARVVESRGADLVAEAFA